MRSDKKADAIVQEALEKAVTTGGEIGLQVAAYKNGKQVIDAWAGLKDETTGEKVDGDTLFNTFSVTKAITATAIHIQVGRGLIDYDASIAEYWPEFAVNGKEHATVRHALTHRLGIPQMPEEVTVEKMCDPAWMASEIAKLTPLFKPGTKTAYLSMTYGWILGELVRLTDLQHRSLGQFVRQEIAEPLGITDLWLGIPDEVESRVARLREDTVPVSVEYLPPLFMKSMPPQVGLTPAVFERPEVRRAQVGGVGGIFNARSTARFFALLAQQGELDGIRLIPEALARSFNTPRANADEPDPVMFGIPVPISASGYWLGGDYPPVCSVRSPQAICHPGAGGSIAWADQELGVAVAICHNRMFDARSKEEDPILPVANSIWTALGY